MENIVKWSLESCLDVIETRKNSFEIFGYDFMIDQNCDTWLIEINSSPAMDYSTPVTAVLVKSVLKDLIKVIIDFKEASCPDLVDTGKFKLLHKSSYVPRSSYNKSDLICQGSGFRRT